MTVAESLDLLGLVAVPMSLAELELASVKGAGSNSFQNRIVAMAMMRLRVHVIRQRVNRLIEASDADGLDFRTSLDVGPTLVQSSAVLLELNAEPLQLESSTPQRSIYTTMLLTQMQLEVILNDNDVQLFERQDELTADDAPKVQARAEHSQEAAFELYFESPSSRPPSPSGPAAHRSISLGRTESALAARVQTRAARPRGTGPRRVSPLQTAQWRFLLCLVVAALGFLLTAPSAERSDWRGRLNREIISLSQRLSISHLLIAVANQPRTSSRAGFSAAAADQRADRSNNSSRHGQRTNRTGIEKAALR